jgi:hypothetical protein
MESGFGRDLGDVRIHTGSEAAAAAGRVHARAYTVGSDIVFGAGEYTPASAAGRRLIAHELAHVVQQQGSTGGVLGVQRASVATRTYLRNLSVGPDGVDALPDDLIAQTEEFRSLMDSGLVWQIKYHVTAEEAMLACRLILADLHAGIGVSWDTEALSYVRDARLRLAVPGPVEPDHFSYDPALDPELKARFNRMVGAMRGKGMGFTTIDDVRPVKTAHIISTAHSIHDKQVISMDALRALPNGEDEDGNVWFRPEWDNWHLGVYPQEVEDNALALARNEGDYLNKAGTGVNCAYEGYLPSDTARLPNVPEVPISNHVTGNAVDLSDIDWGPLGGAWSPEAIAFVDNFELTRPYSPTATTYCIKEPWHFELPGTTP